MLRSCRPFVSAFGRRFAFIVRYVLDLEIGRRCGFVVESHRSSCSCVAESPPLSSRTSDQTLRGRAFSLLVLCPDALSYSCDITDVGVVPGMFAAQLFLADLLVYLYVVYSPLVSWAIFDYLIGVFCRRRQQL